MDAHFLGLPLGWKVHDDGRYRKFSRPDDSMLYTVAKLRDQFPEFAHLELGKPNHNKNHWNDTTERLELAKCLGLPEGWMCSTSTTSRKFWSPEGVRYEGIAKLKSDYPEFAELKLSLAETKAESENVLKKLEEAKALRLSLAETSNPSTPISKPKERKADSEKDSKKLKRVYETGPGLLNKLEEAKALGLPDGWKSYTSIGGFGCRRFWSPEGTKFESVAKLKNEYPEFTELKLTLAENPNPISKPSVGEEASPQKQSECEPANRERANKHDRVSAQNDTVQALKSECEPAPCDRPLKRKKESAQKQTVQASSLALDTVKRAASGSSASVSTSSSSSDKGDEVAASPGPEQLNLAPDSPALESSSSSSSSSSHSLAEVAIKENGDVQCEDKQQSSQAISKPNAPQQPKLLPNWEKHWSDEYKVHYYWNSKTDESIWEIPRS